MTTLAKPVSAPPRVGGSVAPHYDRVQRTFHWGMAAIILTALALGLYSSFLPSGTPLRQLLLEWHKSLGMTALALIVLRVAYRLTIKAPPYAEPLDGLTRLAAHGAHLILYAVMLFMPLTGYLLSSAAGRSVPWFWLFQWPKLVPVRRDLAELGETLHGYGAYVLYGVVSLHILAVIWHSVVKRDSVLARMWPTRTALPRP